MDLKIIQKILRQLRLPDKGLTLQRLHGDASYRTYTRVRAASGESWVVMQMPEGPSSVSEEVTNLKTPPRELPFLNIARTLKGQGLPVPEVLHWDEDNRLLLLEDLGDETIARRFAGWEVKEKETWYRRAIDLLIQLQKSRPDPECLAFQRSFDARLFDWEFDHFIEYGIEARGVKPLPETDRKKIQEGCRRITGALTQLPTTLTHRDFQSRNLMIQGNRLRLIDFQDALQGPYLYDLVALLRDSYVVLEWPMVKRLIDYYLQNQGGGGDASPYQSFDWMTIQRKLKDAGRFVYIDRIKRNPSFLPFVGISLGYVREAFERQRELHPLWERLKAYVAELQ